MLETDGIEGKVIGIGLASLISGKGVGTVELGRLLSEDLGVLDEFLPLKRVQVLEVFQKRNASVLILLTNDLSERQESLRIQISTSNLYPGENEPFRCNGE